MRLGGDHDGPTARFAKWLLDVGDGVCPTTDGLLDLLPGIALPPGSERRDLINHVYAGVSTLDPQHTDSCRALFADRVILAPYNASVDSINIDVLGLLRGEVTTLTSVDEAKTEEDYDADMPTEYVNTLSFPNFPPHKLDLKIGCPVILLRNLAPGEGLCNGTRLILTAVSAKVLRCRIMSGTHMGKDVLIPRITLINKATLKLPLNIHRHQFPVRLAFGMSINKSQGQSLHHVGLDLSMPVFSHGQLYVALSRATQLDSIKALLPPDNNAKTSNVVYKEVFSPP